MTRPFARALARIIMAGLATAALVAGTAIVNPGPAAAVRLVAAESVSAAAVRAPMADLAQFRPGNIISDEVFFDSSTMTETQVSTFLRQKVANCRSGYVCLKDFRQATTTRAADSYCSTYNGEQSESAARIVAKVATACGLNPQVLLVMLEKEQGLITHTWPSDWRYTMAMGQGCPDTAACDTRYYGFFNQVYGAARQLKIYTENKYFTYYAPGKTWNIRWHPNASCGSSPVYIENQATANLYYYTPYQPNAAALRAGYGEGDACSAYGNRNFYQFFTDWFGSTTTQRGAGITRFWQESGGAGGWIGATAGPMREWPGRGWSQRFTEADLYLQNGTTAVQATLGGTREEYRLVGEADSGLGWPTGLVSSAFGGWYQDYERGRIYVRPSDGRGFAVAPPINDEYERVGNVTGALGWPEGRAYRFEGGSRQDFATGSIFQGPSSTTALTAAWTTDFFAVGGISAVGWPSRVVSIEKGEYVQFSAGLMLKPQSGIPVVVRGESYRGYAAAGGVSGPLGLPIENEREDNGNYSQRFEGGYVFVTAGGTFAVTELSAALSAAGGVAALGYPSGPQLARGTSYSQNFGTTTLTKSTAGAFAVSGVIGRHYRSIGAVSSYLGAATGPERAVVGGVIQNFEGGRIFCSTFATMGLPSVVVKAHDAAGGAGGRLGWPTGTISSSTQGQQEGFQGGEIWTTADGRRAVAVVGTVLQTARATGGVARLGAPTAAERELSSGWMQEFAAGVVFVPRNSPASAVTGAIWENYRAGGGLDTYGFATAPSAPVAVAGWTAQQFEQVTVYAGPTRTFVTRGYIRTYHSQQGGPSGVLGVPTQNEYATGGGFRQDFTGGSILVSSTGAFVVRGALRAEYLRRGAETGSLGWPLANELSGDGRWSQRFQGGTLVLTADGAYRVE